MSIANELSKTDQARFDQIKHIGLLKPEQLAEIRRLVHQEILDEQSKEAMKQAKAIYKEAERAALEPEHEKVFITIDVPASSDGLLIDGRKYHHGETIEVANHVAASMREMMQNAWFAETLAGNPNMKSYIPPKRDQFSMLEVGVSLHPRQKSLSRVG